MQLRFVSLPVLFLSLTACAEITNLHCANINWYDFGYQTGLDGRSSSNITREANICRGSSTPPDEDRALDAYRVGLRNHCTPENAFRVGQRDGTLSTACTSRQLAEMQQPFQIGLQDNRLSNQIARLHFDRDNLRDRLDQVDPDSYERREIRRDIRDIDRRIDRLEDRRLLLLALLN